MAVALAVVHVAVPWALGAGRVPGRFGGFARAVRARAEDVYPAATILLAAPALVLADTGFVALWGAWPPIAPVLAVVIGCGFPLLMAALVRRPRRFARFPGRAVRTVLCASAEEVLWRLAALGGLVQAGVPALLAAALSLAGFALLHVPRGGWRVVYYQLLFGAALTVLAVFGGLVAAALCHCAHNLVITATARRAHRPAAPAPTGLPPSRGWGG